MSRLEYMFHIPPVYTHGPDPSLLRIANALETALPKYRDCKDCGAWAHTAKQATGDCRRRAATTMLEDDSIWVRTMSYEGCAESIPKPEGKRDDDH